MSTKSQPKPEKLTANPRPNKLLTFFGQSRSNGMTRFYGVVCRPRKQFSVPKAAKSAEQKNANG